MSLIFKKRAARPTALLLALVFCAFASVYAQKQRLTFNNIPVSGSLNSLVENLRHEGCKLLGQWPEGAFLRGSFVGYGDCTIRIEADGENVGNVKVFMPGQMDWQPLYNNYQYMKETYTMAYGQPSEDVERYSSKDIKDGGDKLEDLLSGLAEIRTVWNTAEGNVSIHAEYAKGSGARVVLTYDNLTPNRAFTTDY